MTDNKPAPCKVCGGRGEKIEMATYVGAPVGGVPVHRNCLQAFYANLEAS